MYSIVFSVALAAVILCLPEPVSAQDGGPAAPTPPVIVPEVVLSEEDTPPPPQARPVEPVAVTSPELLELQQKLRDHPGQRRAGQRVCEAEWSILLGKSNYYPRLNASLSGGNKWIDQSTRADEFGGNSSPEYDGRGVNATLTLRQHLYDWGRNAAIISGYRQDRHIAEIERHNTLNEQLAGLLRMALQYRLQVRLLRHFADAKEVIDRDVASMEQRFKAGAARLAEMRQARLTGLEIESRLTQSQRQRDLVVQAMKTQFPITPQQAETFASEFMTKRPDVPEIVPDERHLLVEARIMAEDIGSIHTGQPAQVSLSAYDVSRYGNLEGHVQRIAQNTTQEENFPPYYQTMIAIPEPKLSKSDGPIEIVPGMAVMVDIIGQKHTVLNYIMTPLNRAAGVAFREN